MWNQRLSQSPQCADIQKSFVGFWLGCKCPAQPGKSPGLPRSHCSMEPLISTHPGIVPWATSADQNLLFEKWNMKQGQCQSARSISVDGTISLLTLALHGVGGVQCLSCPLVSSSALFWGLRWDCKLLGKKTLFFSGRVLLWHEWSVTQTLPLPHCKY